MISGCDINKNLKQGCVIRNFALIDLMVKDSTFKKNEEDNFFVDSLHHKGNKNYAFNVVHCNFEDSQAGFGAVALNSGITFSKSTF